MPEPLTADERDALAASGWTVGDHEMTRVLRFADFAAAIGFVTSVALAAEAADHHPDIAVSWNEVTLTLSTHSAGTLTGLDRDLARRIDALAVSPGPA